MKSLALAALLGTTLMAAPQNPDGGPLSPVWSLKVDRRILTSPDFGTKVCFPEGCEITGVVPGVKGVVEVLWAMDEDVITVRALKKDVGTSLTVSCADGQSFRLWVTRAAAEKPADLVVRVSK